MTLEVVHRHEKVVPESDVEFSHMVSISGGVSEALLNVGL